MAFCLRFNLSASSETPGFIAWRAGPEPGLCAPPLPPPFLQQPRLRKLLATSGSYLFMQALTPGYYSLLFIVFLLAFVSGEGSAHSHPASYRKEGDGARGSAGAGCLPPPSASAGI